MKKFITAVVLLVFNISPIFSLNIEISNKEAHPCDGYWELSYKHPFLDKADSLWELGDSESATRQYEIAYVKLTQGENWEGVIKAINRISVNQIITQPSDTVLKMLDHALLIINEYLNNDLNERAEAYYIKGLYYDYKGDVDSSFKSYSHALEIRRSLFGENHVDIARGYRSIGEMYRYNEQELNAENYLTRASNVLINIGCENTREAGNNYYSMASTYRGLGDLQKARIYCQKALAVYENAETNTYDNRTNCYSLLANISFDEGNFEVSRHNGSVAIKMLSSKRSLTAPQLRRLANYMNTQARTHAVEKDYDSAFHYYRKSKEIYEGLEGSEGDISLIYQNIGINYTMLELFDSASINLDRAIEIRTRVFGHKDSRTSNSLRFMGNLYERMAKRDSALAYYQRAIVAGSDRDFNKYDISANPSFSSLILDRSLLEALWAKGAILSKIDAEDNDIQNLELALETLLIGLEIMDDNQEMYQLEGSTLLMTSDYYGLFEDALEVCYSLFKATADQNYLKQAFIIMEKSKARLLFDTFSDLQKNKLVGIPDSLMSIENSIKSRLASLNRELENAQKKEISNSQEIRNLQEKIFQSTFNLEKFYQSLQANYSSYTNTLKNELLTLADIRNRLAKKNSTLISYFWGDSLLFSLVVKEDQVNFCKQPIDSVNLKVAKYQDHLRVGPQFKNQAAQLTEFFSNSYALYQRLFQGHDITDENPLIIAADGPLRFIPFEALVIKKPDRDKMAYHELNYLIRRNPVSYVYSANLWAMQPNMPSGKLRALGFSHASSENTTTIQGDQIPGTKEEVDMLKNRFQGLYFSGPEATKQNFIKHAQNYDVIHLAIHGISDSISRLNNRLLFRSTENKEITEPLYTYELYNLRLNSKLTVLSACESGVGRNFKGEGIYSMSRAFSYAGCPTTVMSLWRISDKTTPEILERFYQQIFRGKETDRAMREAKLNYLSDNPGNLAHPMYWAPMVVHGSADSVVNYSPYKSLTITLAGLAFLLLVFYFTYQKRKGRPKLIND